MEDQKYEQIHRNRELQSGALKVRRMHDGPLRSFVPQLLLERETPVSCHGDPTKERHPSSRMKGANDHKANREYL
jgi:hypothetical protein